MKKTSTRSSSKPRNGNVVRPILEAAAAARAERNGSYTFTRVEPPGRTTVKFVAREEWVTGEVNGQVYIPKEQAEGVRTVTVTLNK